MNRKFLLVLLILSITPFIRGCGETFGFPLPFMENVVSPGILSATWENILEDLQSTRAIVLIVINILFATLVCSIMSRNVDRLKWIGYVMVAMALGLVMIWTMTAIYILDINTSNPKEPLEKVSQKYSKFFNYLYYKVPLKVSDVVAEKNPWKSPKPKKAGAPDPLGDTLDDVLSRAWFVFVSLLAGFLLYLVLTPFRFVKEKIGK